MMNMNNYPTANDFRAHEIKERIDKDKECLAHAISKLTEDVSKLSAEIREIKNYINKG